MINSYIPDLHKLYETQLILKKRNETIKTSLYHKHIRNSSFLFFIRLKYSQQRLNIFCMKNKYIQCFKY